MPSDTPTIEVFREATITCSDAGFDGLRALLVGSALAPWHHAPDREEYLAHSPMHDDDTIVFRRDEQGGIPAAFLFLVGRASQHGSRYDLVNVVPSERRQLEIAEYNDVVEDFIDQVVQRDAPGHALTVSASKRRQTITDWTSQEAAEALVRFSRGANMSTGSSHPLDAERWRQFLIADHRAGRPRMDSSHFERWLVEVEGWPHEGALDLTIDRDKALELLDDYDRVR